ncbi:MAG: NAD-dependent epimerase/dehydratase family protein [Polyangiaceae bacterium]|nr:NAD-dependent epimerase/dehydratase family protein [Polyangiaceae bacterium]
MSSTATQRIKTAVVTGGAGAIGSRLVHRLLSDGAERVLVIDDLSSGYRWLLPKDDRVELLVKDVCDMRDVPAPADAPTVFHLAAFFANQNSVDHPLDDLHTNGRGTLTTLLWARARSAAAVVYASAGCSIAGHGIEAPIREDMPVSLHLDTPYQITKALGEFYCNYFGESLHTVRCRFFNSYGPGEVPGHYRNVIPNFIWRALTGQPLIITGTGDETRDFIFVDDLVDGLVRSATTPGARGDAINLGTGVQTRIGDLAEWVLAACQSKSRIEYAPRRAWDKSTHREANIDKAKSVLGLRPSVTVRAGLERTVAWFHGNREAIRAAAETERARSSTGGS